MKLENMIPGIYSYCDNWCNRCAFTAQCEVFAREQVWRNSKGEVSDADIMEYVSQNLAQAMSDLQLLAKEHGIDLTDLTLEAEQAPADTVSMAEQVEIEQLAKAYGFDVEQWLSENVEFFEAYNAQLQQQAELNIGVDMQAIESLTNAIDTIKWYQYLVAAKIHRAVNNMYAPLDDEDDYQNDANGSAKVAMIAIGNSIAAWEVFMETFPEKSDDIILLLGSLQRIQQMVRQIFPRYEGFKRPGFDD